MDPKKKQLKPVLLIHPTFHLSFFKWGREKWERITNCTFSHLIDFHHKFIMAFIIKTILAFFLIILIDPCL